MGKVRGSFKLRWGAIPRKRNRGETDLVEFLVAAYDSSTRQREFWALRPPAGLPRDPFAWLLAGFSTAP